MSVPSLIALVLTLGMFVGLAWGLFRLLKPSRGEFMVCTTCGHCGPARVVTRGSLMIELVLWLALIVPGLIYSLWRLSTRHSACESCGSSTLVKPGSPVGRRVLAGSGRAEAMPAEKAPQRAPFSSTWAVPRR